MSEHNHPQGETVSYEQAAALYAKLESRAADLRQAHASPRRPRLGWRLRSRTTLWLGGATACAVIGVAALIFIGGLSSDQVTFGLSGDHARHVSTSHFRPPVGDTGGSQDRQHSPEVPYGQQGITTLNQDYGDIDPGFGHDPFGVGGRRVSLAAAERIAHFAVLIPDSPLASSKNLTDIWFRPVGNGSGTRSEMILEYASTGVRISIRPANTVLLTDASGEFAKMARDVHATPGAMAINGAPALVQDGNRRNPGFAELVRDGVAVAVMGPYSAADLITVAQSLSLETSGND